MVQTALRVWIASPQPTRACLGAHTLRLKSASVESVVGCVGYTGYAC